MCRKRLHLFLCEFLLHFISLHIIFISLGFLFLCNLLLFVINHTYSLVVILHKRLLQSTPYGADWTDKDKWCWITLIYHLMVKPPAMVDSLKSQHYCLVETLTLDTSSQTREAWRKILVTLLSGERRERREMRERRERREQWSVMLPVGAQCSYWGLTAEYHHISVSITAPTHHYNRVSFLTYKLFYHHNFCSHLVTLTVVWLSQFHNIQYLLDGKKGNNYLFYKTCTLHV